MALLLNACASASTQNPAFIQQPNATQTVQALLDRPLDCEFQDVRMADVGENDGYATPLEAFNALANDERPKGNPTQRIEQETIVIWIYTNADRKTGSIQIVETDMQKWVVAQVKTCVE